MADIDFDSSGVMPRFGAETAQRMFHLAGAGCSLALIIGLVAWGYNLAVRDVAGVPIIRAAEGPMRVAPTDPGGQIADHIGMAVNAVAEMRPSGGLPEEIILAPAPLDLSLDDQVVTVPEPGPVGVVEASAAGRIDTGEATPVVASTDEAVALALSSLLEDALADTPSDTRITGAEERVARSPRPAPRPERIALNGVTSVAARVPLSSEVDPASLAIGARLVQLGAFDSQEIARSEWTRLAARFGDLMSGKAAVLQPAVSGGRTFYRLRAAGFENEDDARRFCAALLAEDAACVPVTHL